MENGKVDYITQMQIESHLVKLEKLFTEDCLITLIVRKPDNDDADIVLTRDSLDEVISLIKRRQPNG